jgi:gamma-glutamyltranspeptidase/glutathione hydrolase
MSGYKILAQGGDAIEAAVAACFASTVVEPSRSGIGGDALILIYRAKTNEIIRVSAAARRRMARAQRLRWKEIKQAASPEPAKHKRSMSAAAQKRIAATQKKRWAAIKKASKG